MKATIVCPTFNSEKFLHRSLQSWAEFDFPKSDYEILICDRNSSDKTKEIVEEFKKKYPHIKYIESLPRTSTQRNNGIKNAKGSVIVFFDDDSVADHNYLNTGLEFLEQHPEIGIAGGPQVDSPHDRFFARAAGTAMSSFFGSFTMSSRYKKTKLDFDACEFNLTSANVFIRKEILDKIGGFDESLYPGEDPEFFARAKLRGIKMAFNPELAVQHSRRPDLQAFCKQHFKYGYVRVLKEKISKSKFPANLVFFVPSLFLIYILTLPFVFLLNKNLALPALLYAAGACVFSIEAAAYKKNWLALPLVPFLFFAMHISYGAGFLRGLMKITKTR